MDSDIDTPLVCAASNGHNEVLKILLQAGMAPDMLNQRGDTPLMWAVQNGRENCMLTLLQAGASVNLHSTTGGYTALMCAACEGKVGCL